MQTEKAEIIAIQDHNLKRRSIVVSNFTLRNLNNAAAQNIGVKIPTIYRGDKNGETSFKL